MKQVMGVLAIHGVFWAYPFASGGLSNVLGVAAWLLALTGLLMGLLFIFSDKPVPREGMSQWRRLAQRFSLAGILVCLAWYGHIALAVVLIVMAIILRLKAAMDKEAQ